MGYGKRQIVDKKPIKERKKEEQYDIGEIEINKKIDDVNIELNTIFYQDHPDSIPPDGFKKKPSIKEQLNTTGKTIISQSLIKKVINKYQEEEEFCPKFIYHCYIKKDAKTLSKENQLRGMFFETHLIGGTVSGSVYDLPRKKLSQKKRNEYIAKGLEPTGDKKISQIRLETQIERAKRRAEILGIDIVPGYNTQVYILKKWDEDYYISGTMDIFPVGINYDGGYKPAIIDVKTTEDVNLKFGPFSWGKPQYMDHIQGDMYHYLIRNIDFDLNPHLKEIVDNRMKSYIENELIKFYYWVWGYQKEPLEEQEKIIERMYRDESGSNIRQKELKERIRKTIAIIEREEAFGWEANPVENQCKACPFNKTNGGDCPETITTKV